MSSAFPQRETVSRDRRWGRKTLSGVTVWLTGLSGSGKSTIAEALAGRLADKDRATHILDADNLRLGLNHDLGFTEADRRENVRRVGEVAALLSDAGLVTIVPIISPYRGDREAVRRLHTTKGLDFIEVHVATPLEVCEARDPKGLYSRARAGEFTGMTGIDAPYETPDAAEVVIEAGTGSTEAAASIEMLLS